MSDSEVADDWELEADEEIEPSKTTDKVPDAVAQPSTIIAASLPKPLTASTNDDVNASDSEDEQDAIDDDDENNETKENPVLRAYRFTPSRRVDLVGDYAGTELFVIDGDSLLLRAFEDEHLDFDNGFQLLHAVYIVEQFLFALITRKCHFDIVFTDSKKDLCMPIEGNVRNLNKYRLARTAIIRHLTVHLPKAHPDIAIYRFPSYFSESFTSYLARTEPYFIMLHDGAKVGRTPNLDKGTTNLESSVAADYRVSLRATIVHFLQTGYNVALINGLTWRDTKVMTLVLERRKGGKGAPTPKETSDIPPSSTAIDTASLLESWHGTSSRDDLTESQELAILTIHAILQDSTTTQPEDVQLSCIFLAHLAILPHISLTSRRVEKVQPKKSVAIFVNNFSKIANSILSSPEWEKRHGSSSSACDLADLIDGRLLYHLYEQPVITNKDTQVVLQRLLDALDALPNQSTIENTMKISDGVESDSNVTSPPTTNETVLPFSNPTFDKHLESVRLKEDEDVTAEPSPIQSKVFRELTHWHNAKKPIAAKGQVTVSRKDKFWADRRNQWFMAEMRTYAASLTNAVGKSLEPETIIEGQAKAKAVPSGNKKSMASSADSDTSDASSTKQKSSKSSGGKNAAKAAGKDAMLRKIALDQAKKNESANNKIVIAWQTVCNNMSMDRDPRDRYRRAKNHQTNLQPAHREVIAAEVELYMLNQLIEQWIVVCSLQQERREMELLALIWNSACNTVKCKGLTKTILSCAKLTITTLKLPELPEADLADTASDRKLAFQFVLPTKAAIVPNTLSATDFQLAFCGPYLERSFDSAPDDRVDFHPDGWQRQVLDALDKDESVFVVAPTSAGKTFISFYAMKKVLEQDSDGVIVYVAPTKALVNQIAAEIQARYSKNYKHGGKSVWAIHTRDYRINNPTGCQVLVTVPHVLQIMLLAPSHANSWSTRIRRIIFDEVHSIGQAEDGVVWEQLLLLAPCPIIALSATVGNPGEFAEWLGSTQNAIGQKLVTVEHPHRYSDLRKYFYLPPEKFSFQGLPDRAGFGALSLDGVSDFHFIHPVGGLTDKSRGIPRDLALEPRDCHLLWQSMVKHEKADYKVPSHLRPHDALPGVVRKADIIDWEAKLKALLSAWLRDNESPYDSVVKDLGHGFNSSSSETVHVSREAEDSTVSILPADDLTATTLPLLCRLENQDALPAIVFNFDRHQCENICLSLLEQLRTSETEQVKSGKKWQNRLEKWEEWKKIQAKAAAKKPKVSSKKGSKGDDDERESKLDLQKDAGGQETSPWESFDPDAPQPGYYFADYTRAQKSELEVYIRQLGRRNVPQYLIDALGRGIGVHHAGMNRKYRQVVEILFRKRFLRVIIATGTLALGINMPAKTVVFSGDSVFLTALNFRQCAGRAGRRGFDLLGNVVFQGISRQKVRRLLSSRLPDLNGHFPLTTTLVLRMFTLLHESKQSKYAVSAINALLSQPRLFLGGPSFKEATMHHLRFSIEYLRRQHLLSSYGATLNFAGLVSHLYFTERSAFAFHALIKGGYFHKLCANIHQQPKSTVQTLMLVMANIFSRVHCRKADEEYKTKVVKPSSSIVFLPPLPSRAATVLREHNQQTLSTYQTYVATFIDQHIHHDDDKLPTTGVTFGSSGSSSEKPVKIRSPFVALSGVGDSFASIHDLCSSVRAGVFLEEEVIPYIPVHPDTEDEPPLNAWLLDFFKHGDVHTLEKANGIRRSDIWFMLNDFSLILATIIASLMNYMRLIEATDLDMLDVMGDFDTHEEERDDQVAADEAGSDVSGPSAADSGIVIDDSGKSKRNDLAVRGKKSAKNVDSWEDTADAETAADDREKKRREMIESEEQAEKVAAAAGLKDEGLKDVLLAFQQLHSELTVKFKAMWA